MIDLAARVREWLDAPRPVDHDPAILGATFLRQLGPPKPPGGEHPIRGSNVGACARRLAYRRAGAPEAGKTIDHVSRITFAVGDVVEALATIALVASLPEGWAVRHVREGQHDGTWKPWDGLEVPLHTDGLGRTDEGEGFTVEVKSAKDYKYKDWKRHGWGLDEPYRFQVHAAQAAYRVRWTLALVVNKTDGTIDGWWIEWSDEVDALLREHLRKATAGPPEETPRTLPDGTELGPKVPGPKVRGRVDGEAWLPWQCRYCPHWRTCWPEAREEWRASKQQLVMPAPPDAPIADEAAEAPHVDPR